MDRIAHGLQHRVVLGEHEDEALQKHAHQQDAKDAQELAHHQDRAGDGLGDHCEDGFVVDFATDGVRGNERSQNRPGGKDGGQPNIKQHALIVFQGVGRKGVGHDQQEDGHAIDNQHHRLPDRLSEGVSGDGKKQAKHLGDFDSTPPRPFGCDPRKVWAVWDRIPTRRTDCDAPSPCDRTTSRINKQPGSPALAFWSKHRLAWLLFFLESGRATPWLDWPRPGSCWGWRSGWCCGCCSNSTSWSVWKRLEHDDIAGGESGLTDDESRVAARRLRTMHRITVPASSLIFALCLGGLGWLHLNVLRQVRMGEAEFDVAPNLGWAVAIGVGLAVVSFIFSRFTAGMAKQPVWRNLRGGAAWTAGNALLLLVVAASAALRYLGNDVAAEAVAWVVPVFEFVLAAEIVLNFVLWLYRPRIPGEAPRAPFDSRLLSLLAAPDNLVRSIQEAVDFQFGFDVTGSWGWRLLTRRLPLLLAVGVLTLAGLSSLQVVEPSQQGVRLRFGEPVTDAPLNSGLHFKLPWPIEQVEMYDIARIRSLPLTSTLVNGGEVQLWTDDLGKKYDRKLDPFLVKSGADNGDGFGGWSLIDAEMRLQYRLLGDDQLWSWIDLGGGRRGPRDAMSPRQKALRALTLAEIEAAFRSRTLEEVLSADRGTLARSLRNEVKASLAEYGVDVVSIDLLMLRPAGEAAGAWEELNVRTQQRTLLSTKARETVETGFVQLLGKTGLVDPLVEAITQAEALERGGASEDEISAAVDKADAILFSAGGEIGARIDAANGERWVRVLEAESLLARVRGQTRSWQAGGDLYRQRQIMNVYAATLPGMRKFVAAVDPSRLDIDMDLKTIDPLFAISDALGTGDEGLSE